VFIETGNIGELASYREAPAELNLPDHLVFAGEKNIIQFLTEAHFSITSIARVRTDGVANLAKNVLKKAMGRKVTVRLPYTSDFRTLLIRARLKPGHSK